MTAPQSESRALPPRHTPAQALVELALVMPVLVGIIAVLFQFGVLFMVQLSVVHSTRDIARWLAYNPDKTDAEVQTYISNDLPTLLSGTTFVYAPTCDPANPGVGQLCVQVNPTCASKDATTGLCLLRVPGTTPEVLTMSYNPSRNVFLPSSINLGFFKGSMPWPAKLRYDYQVMIETR